MRRWKSYNTLLLLGKKFRTKVFLFHFVSFFLVCLLLNTGLRNLAKGRRKELLLGKIHIHICSCCCRQHNFGWPDSCLVCCAWLGRSWGSCSSWYLRGINWRSCWKLSIVYKSMIRILNWQNFSRKRKNDSWSSCCGDILAGTVLFCTKAVTFSLGRSLPAAPMMTDLLLRKLGMLRIVMHMLRMAVWLWWWGRMEVTGIPKCEAEC